MADRNEEHDSSNIEIIVCEEPQLEATQDLELLAQEIAEAAVDEERKVTRTPSPPIRLPSSEGCDTAPRGDMSEEDGLDKCEDDLTQLDASMENVRSSSPVDEASWVMVEASEDEEQKSESIERKFSVFRKFLARGDLRQKLAELGFLSEASPQACGNDNKGEQSLQNMMMSCNESIVICDFPQEDDTENSSNQVFIKDSPDGFGKPKWKGTISGATVALEMERQGGLMVAAVTVWHRDLLSALNSLRNLVSSAGLVSYADVDVTSLLARAA